MMPRVGVAQWCLDRGGPVALDRAAELGLSAIHLDAGGFRDAPPLRDPAVRHAYRESAARSGVRIAGIGVNSLNVLGLTSPAGSLGARRCADEIRAAIEAAAALNADLVYLPSFEQSEIRDRAGLERTAETLRAACDEASGTRLTLATENTLDWRDNLELLRAVDRPGLRVLFDVLNPILWGCQPVELVERLWPCLCDQIHAKDGRGGAMGNASLGAGDAGFAATAAALRERGFAGTIVLENEYARDAEILVARDLAALADWFDPTEMRSDASG